MKLSHPIFHLCKKKEDFAAYNYYLKRTPPLLLLIFSFSLYTSVPPLFLPPGPCTSFLSSSFKPLTVVLHIKTLLPLHNADAPSVGRMKLPSTCVRSLPCRLGLMMAQRPAHCPSAYAHSHIRVWVCECASASVCVCARRGWQGSSCWLKATPPSQSPSEKDSREHEPLSGWPRWGHRIRVTWIYRPNMTAKLWSLVWDVSRLQSLGLFSCKWCQVWTECEWDSSHCPRV